MRTATIGIGYALLNFRYGGMALPFGIVTYLLGAPGWAVVATTAAVVLALVAELYTAAAHGILAALQDRQSRSAYDALALAAETYANGGWLNGGIEGQEPEYEGEGDEGEGPVPVRP